MNFLRIKTPAKALLVMLLAVMAVPAISYAEPGSSDPVLLHCQATLPAKIRSACQNDKMDIINRARNVATYHCKDEPEDSGAAARCVEKEAKSYITKANNQKPKTAGDFKKEFEKVIDKAGGNPDKPYKGSDKSSTDPSKNNCTDRSCVDPAAVKCTQQTCDVIDKYINPAINLFSLVFGLIAAASLIAGGILYQMSAGDSQKVTMAKKRILNTLIAVVAYMFLYAFLQFLVPGGVFNRGG